MELCLPPSVFMSDMQRTRTKLPTLALAALLGLTGLSQIGCQHQRAVQAPDEPTWSYHDGQDRLSSNDAWSKLIPPAALLPGNTDAQVASVEDATE